MAIKRWALILTTAAAGLPALVGAQGGRSMTIDDLLAAIRVTDPQVTADGRQVAFVRATTDLQAGRRNGDIWIVPADGSAPPKLLAGGDKGESAPRFSGDGRKLAFISTRAGAAGVRHGCRRRRGAPGDEARRGRAASAALLG